MEHKKPLLGLKAAPLRLFEESDDDDSFFDDDSADLQNIPLQPSQSRINIIDSLGKLPTLEPINKIKSFDDVYPRIMHVLSALEEMTIFPEDNNHNEDKNNFYFVPENIVPDDFSIELKAFVESDDPNATFNFPKKAQSETREIHQNVFAQIDIVKYAKKQQVDLAKYDYEILDSRILSLIHYLLAKTDNNEMSCYYCTQSLLEIVKTSDSAPISVLFPEYTIKNIIHLLSVRLVALFPHHPLLESVLHKFSSYDPSAPDTMLLIPAEDDDDDDDSDSFDDSFFAEIRAAKVQGPAIELQNIFNKQLVNPLDTSQQSPSNVVTITVNEPPSTVTFHFANGSTQLPPNLFTDWILGLNIQQATPKKVPSKKDQIFGPPSGNVTMLLPRQPIYLSAVTPSTSGSVLLRDSNHQEASQTMLLDLLQYVGQSQKLLSLMPNSVDPTLFSYHMPLIQSLNATSVTPLKRGCLYPQLIVNEFDALQGLKKDDTEEIARVIKEMTSRIPENLQTVPIKPLAKKRPFPLIDTPSPLNLVAALSLSDMEIVLAGRSPLTLERISRDPMVDPPYPKKWRAEALYYIYTSEVLPPYISFRAAFALALNLADSTMEMSSFALDVLFEGIYLLLDAIPQMSTLECVRISLLFFGELLDKLDKYYYSALVLDAYYLGDSSCVTSSPIGPICQHKGDTVRAIFHFNQSMKHFVDSNKCDEALYVSQVIASIYNDYGMFHCSISLLTFLLHRTYNISIGRRIEKVPMKRTKTLPPVRRAPPTIALEPFEPKQSGTNTLLCGISLADLLVKCRYFKMAKSLLTTLTQSTDNKLYIRLIDFISLKLLLKKNKFKKFISKIPPFVVRQKRTSCGSKLTLLAASTFDTVIAMIKMLMSAYLHRNLFGQAIFYAEIIMNTQNRQALKDVGLALLTRGEAFLRYAYIFDISHGPLSVHVPIDFPSSANVSKYVDDHVFTSKAEIISEAVSTFKAARLCFEKLCCTRKLLTSNILYISAVLLYFIDGLYSPSDQIEHPLEINVPRLETESLTIKLPLAVTFEPYSISQDNVEDELSMLCQGIETQSQRFMHPVFIIYSQTVVAKFNLLQKKTDVSQTRFDFAYTNFRKMFTCGGYLVTSDFSLKMVRLFHTLLEQMCHLLLQYEPQFINNHLSVFDWFSDCDAIQNHMIRVVPRENPEPIDSTINVSTRALHEIASVQFPDFFPTLIQSHVEVNDNPPITDATIASYIVRINANIRLFDTQKMKEDEMHENNRSLCRQIEQLADQIRHDSPELVPAETEYKYATSVSPIAAEVIFVERLFGAVYVYVPQVGKKKVCTSPSLPSSLSSSLPSSLSSSSSSSSSVISPKPSTFTFSVSRKSADVQFTSSSSLFPIGFYEYLLQILLPDRSNRKLSTRPFRKMFTELKKSIFANMDLRLTEWDKKPDHAHFIGGGGKTAKGALATIVTSPHPVVISTSNDLRSIPFEVVFPEYLVLRCWNFTQLILPVATRRDADGARGVQTVLFRRKAEFEASTSRALDLMSYCTTSMGAAVRSGQVQLVLNDERNFQFMSPAFLSNKETVYYTLKYPFCLIVEQHLMQQPQLSQQQQMANALSDSSNRNSDVNGNINMNVNSNKNVNMNSNKSGNVNSNKSGNVNSNRSGNESGGATTLFLFSYADMVENHSTMREMAQKFTSAFFLFIPGQMMKEALKTLKFVFERQKKRIEYVLEHPLEEGLGEHTAIAHVPFDFVTAVQATLARALNCPVPLIAPAH